MRLETLIIIGVLFGVPASAAYRVQQITQVPTEPGQTLSSMVVDSHGNTIVGATTATSAFVISLDPSGNRRFTHALSVSGPLALALDSNDDIYAAGAGGAFKLSGLDGGVVYATSLPASGPFFSANITVDRAGQAVLAIGTAAADTATTPGAYVSPRDSGIADSATLLIRLSASGTQIFRALYNGTTHYFYGSSTQEPTIPSYSSPTQVLVDTHNNIWVSGWTNTIDLPVTPNAMKPVCGCSIYAGDGFLAEFSSDGSTLLYATYIGTTPGNLWSRDGNDLITAMAADSAGHLWLAGSTNGPDLPVTSNALQSHYSGILTDGTFIDPLPPDPTDAFLFEYDPATNHALYVTYFGGTGADTIQSIAAASDGTIVFTGTSASLPFELSGFTRGSSFIAGLNGQDLTVTTLIGGSAGTGLSLLPAGSVAISGTGNAVTVLQPASDTTPNLVGITNAAGTLATGQVAPGELVALYGANLGPATPATADLSSGNAPTQLGGVQVLADGNPMPLLYVQNDQVNAIIPFGASGITHLVVTHAGENSNPAMLGVIPADPQAFKIGSGVQAAALSQDQTVNSSNNPAQLGTIVSVFATGFGQLAPQAQVILNYPLTDQPPQPLQVIYAGPAPTLVAGVTQVNFKLPSTLLYPVSPGAPLSISFNVAGWPSATFSAAVRN